MMKRSVYIAASFLFLLPFIAEGQDTPVRMLFSSYESHPGFNSTVILADSTSFNFGDGRGSESLSTMFESIDELRVLNVKPGTEVQISDMVEFNDKVTAALNQENYKPLFIVKTDEESIGLYALKESGSILSEMSLYVKDADGIFLIIVTGNIDLSSISLDDAAEGMRALSGVAFGAQCN